MKRTRIDLLYSSLLALLAYAFHFLWAARYGPDYLPHTAYGTWLRPYVFRLLLPGLAQVLERITGASAVTWLIVLFVASAVGLYFSVRALCETVLPDGRAAAFVICLATFVLIYHEGQYYDLATAAFFSLAIACLVREHLVLYLLLFPLATLNRETTFLLIIAFGVLSLARYGGRVPRPIFYVGVIQVFVWIGIRALTIAHFADNPGFPYLWRPGENLRAYAELPGAATLLLAGFALILWRVFALRQGTPAALQAIFWAIFPLQILLHGIMGYPWELRIYAESFPLLCLLAGPVVHSLPRRAAVSAVTAIKIQ